VTTVTSFTAERMLEIENETITDAHLSGNDLILTTREGTDINVGSVRGPTGATGTTGSAGAGFAIGQIGHFPKSPLPSGWLECDGTTKSIATYPALAAYLGTTYGGNGTTTFGLPGYGGRVLAGRDSGQSEFDVVGELGGAKTHTLTVTEMPSHGHAHTLVPGDHQHYMDHSHVPVSGGAFVSSVAGFTLATPGGLSFSTAASTGGASTAYTGGATSLVLGGSISTTGGGIAHNNLQPYRVVLIGIYSGV
jgi:microcystin-dependent protein